MPTGIPKANRERSAKLASDLEAFLADGGQIQKVPFGQLTQPAGMKRPRNASHRSNGVPMRVVSSRTDPNHAWRSPLPPDG